jgi:hypothetical protein
MMFGNWSMVCAEKIRVVERLVVARTERVLTIECAVGGGCGDSGWSDASDTDMPNTRIVLLGGIGCSEAMSTRISMGLGSLRIIVPPTSSHHPHSQPSCVNNHRLPKGYIRRREYIA